MPGMPSNPVRGFGGNGGGTFGANNGSGFGGFGSNAGLVPGSGVVPDSDPNSIFKNPINAPTVNMADPF